MGVVLARPTLCSQPSKNESLQESGPRARRRSIPRGWGHTSRRIQEGQGRRREGHCQKIKKRKPKDPMDDMIVVDGTQLHHGNYQYTDVCDCGELTGYDFGPNYRCPSLAAMARAAEYLKKHEASEEHKDWVQSGLPSQKWKFDVKHRPIYRDMLKKYGEDYMREHLTKTYDEREERRKNRSRDE